MSMTLHRILKFPCSTIWKSTFMRHSATVCARSSASIPHFALEQPRQPSFGEMAVPVAFQLAKSLKQPPKKIAADLVAAVGEIPGVAAMEVAGNGYINIRFDRGAYGAALLARRGSGRARRRRQDHRRAHQHQSQQGGAHRPSAQCRAGRHVRAHAARARQRVEVQNYIDNTGVQVADVVAGFHFLEKKTPAEVGAIC